MDELRGRLERWVRAGAIGRDQADAILALEAEEGRRGGGRRAVAAEALGYVGGALALVAGIAIGAGQFARLGSGGKMALLGVVTLGLLAAGWWLRTARATSLRRLGSLLWFLSVGSLAGLLQVWAQDWTPFPFHQQLLPAAGATLYAGGLWLLERRALQQVALFIPATATAVLVAAEFTAAPRREELLAGWVQLAMGAAWLELGRRGLLRPRRTSEALGSLAMVVGVETLWAGGTAAWALGLGVGLALALVVAGSAARRTVLLGMGGGALLLFLAEIAGDYWTSLGAPLAILLVGLGLVALAVIIARVQPRARAGPGAEGVRSAAMPARSVHAAEPPNPRSSTR